LDIRPVPSYATESNFRSTTYVPEVHAQIIVRFRIDTSLPAQIRHKKSSDFIFNRFLMKLFKTTDINVATNCQRYFGTQPHVDIIV